jgi:hypothetical protein
LSEDGALQSDHGSVLEDRVRDGREDAKRGVDGHA